MRRTVIALWMDDPETTTIESASGQNTTLQVEDVQETLDGLRVYSGEAAHIGQESVDQPLIHGDGSIEMTTQSVETRTRAEWFAVPDAPTPFAAINTSDGDFVRSMLSRQTGAYLRDAEYYLTGLVDELEDRHDPTWWQVGWSDEDDPGESGMFYPNTYDDSDQAAEQFADRGLRRNLNQVGFSYFGEEIVRGTVAGSGYLELYSPSDWGVPEMARYLMTTAIPHAYVPETDTGGEAVQRTLGGGTTDDVSCDQCGRETDVEEIGDQELCIVCRDQRDESATGGTA
ncbi:hypothetical protein ACFPYI_01690 [Halomarina salina]|uniref:Uncharacterized protein n=1 Tax=Halomarina salina TaxID=1872699 RepID=A0ABD5RHK1_9EURY|nr:hypothetical protein [Halomarina salina]